MANKHVFAIHIALLFVSIIAMMFLIGYARPLVIAPIDDLQTSNSSVLFEFEKADIILIDDNRDFTSPDRLNVNNNFVINLKPGTYYWKAQGAGGLESDIRELKILSNVDLKMKKRNNKYVLVNAGNTILNVEIYNNTEFKKNLTLAVDEEKDEKGTKFIASQNE